MDYTISNIPDSEREFSDGQMILINCAYIMNDLQIHLGEDWEVRYPNFTPSMMFLKFVVQRKNSLPPMPPVPKFQKVIRLNIGSGKYTILQGIFNNKIEDSLGKKTIEEVAEFIKNKFQQQQ